ncbi:hypothetical protein Ais01nite_01830 [Asanoa ishikariensis]|uniref:Putative peptidoglycan binding domain-containing protein n=1 Tax=Asanoa ishikariensis TaxID=137265 RepID=A0A1H3TPM9_9ACTN|nr:peptidoglycan-binding domain-containing protein [Asanoa ishikariensis]GIF62148.1 hypothetical protein Ais01nite_01830 [Asanoa ishikariensis]SDZ51289.1 Putative peptidoglycan binding domain-containing protein [Asanoa ishikariensis]
MLSSTFRRVLAGLCVTVLASVGLAATGPPASAAPLICNTVNDVWNTGVGPDKAAVAFPTYGGYQSDCDLRMDESWSNPAVRVLQSTLNACYGPYAIYHGHDGGKTRQLSVDGEYGPNTLAAVQEFQRWWNSRNPVGEADLTVDGYAGPNTRSKMKWVSNGLYGGRCTTVVKNPEITPTAPPGVRGIPNYSPDCVISRTAITASLHGRSVFLDRCGNGTRVRMENAPAGAVVSVDRSNFRSPDYCVDDKGKHVDCYLDSYEIGVRSENPRYHFRDDSSRSGNTVVSPWIAATDYYTRPCLLLVGYYQCWNKWYADTDA